MEGNCLVVRTCVGQLASHYLQVLDGPYSWYVSSAQLFPIRVYISMHVFMRGGEGISQAKSHCCKLFDGKPGSQPMVHSICLDLSAVRYYTPSTRTMLAYREIYH